MPPFKVPTVVLQFIGIIIVSLQCRVKVHTFSILLQKRTALWAAFVRESIAAAVGSIWCDRRPAGDQQMSTGHMHFFCSIPSPLFCSKKKDTHKGVLLFGAGYGSRTRLHGLGSRCITDIRILRTNSIIAEPTGKFKAFLSTGKGKRPGFLRGGGCNFRYRPASAVRGPLLPSRGP